MHTFLWEGLEADIRIFMRILLALESRVVYSILMINFMRFEYKYCDLRKYYDG